MLSQQKALQHELEIQQRYADVLIGNIKAYSEHIAQWQAELNLCNGVIAGLRFALGETNIRVQGRTLGGFENQPSDGTGIEGA